VWEVCTHVNKGEKKALIVRGQISLLLGESGFPNQVG
jgi:hypothetical protein